MRTFALCCIGFLVGTAAAFITQTPVLETLGYAPEKPVAVTSADPAVDAEENMNAVANGNARASMGSGTVTASDSNENKKKPHSAAVAKSSPARDVSELPEHYRLFTKGEFLTDQSYRLPYRLLKPAKIVPGKRYPLTVFLHGAGERGSDNYSQLDHGSEEFVRWIAKSKIDSFVLFPQCPLEEQWADHFWYETEHTMKATPSKSMNALLGLIDELKTTQPVDEDHIFATGLSMGGFGVYDLIARRPGMFSAGVAICGGSDCTPQFVEKLKSTRMYIVHGRDDEVVSVENSRNVVQALRKVGANPKYLELPGIGHNSWATTFKKDDVFTWLYAGIKPTDHKELAKTRIGSNPAPLKITNIYSKPKTANSTPSAEAFAGASSKPPSIQPKTAKKPVVKKEVVVAKPPMRDIKSEVAVKKTPVMKPKSPVAEPKTVPKTMSSATAKPAIKTKDLPKPMEVAKTAPAKPKDDAKPTMVKKPETMKPSRLSGSWQVIKAVHGGRALSDKQTKAMAMEFVGGDIVIKHGKKRETGKFNVGEIVKTNASEFAELEIKSSRKNMPSIKGFYTKNGDVLTMVWGAPGAKRPDPKVGEEIKAARTLTLQPSDVN